jgi:predicted Zn-dependent protease
MLNKRNIWVFILMILMLANCAKVPVTGRSQLSIVKNSELIPMSFNQYDGVLEKSNLSKDQEQVAKIKKVGTRIQQAVEKYLSEQGQRNVLNGFEWEFNLIEEETVNAWCMPGGKVAFYTGILPICQDEIGIAVVMGHEVAHAIANHGRERMSQGLVANLGLATLSMATQSNQSLTNQILLQSVGAGTQLGILKFSRIHESEADRMGLIFMSIAGYDPTASPAFWERMARLPEGQKVPDWLSTHPSNSTRISDLKKSMPEALTYYKLK